ncbi:hypothetical protein IKF32_03460 [Candidatus Saccharibacteria bacterium]|nr:hypothetical protein [Candidatus Saccharibacteria bacterium]
MTRQAKKSSANNSKQLNIILAIGGILAGIALIVAIILVNISAKPLHYKLSNEKEAWAIVEFQAGIKAIPNDKEFWISHDSCVTMQKMSLKFGQWFSEKEDFCDKKDGNMWGTFKKDGNIYMTLYYDGHVASYIFDEDFEYVEKYSFKEGPKVSDAMPLLIKSRTMEELENIKEIKIVR